MQEYLESNGLTNLQANREKWITEMVCQISTFRQFFSLLD